MSKTKKTVKNALKIAGIILLVLILTVVGYLAYVLLGYYRVEDNLPLDVFGGAVHAAPVDEELTLVTYNIGFGAYSDDYSFFMDGGKYARAYSEAEVHKNTAGALAAATAAAPDFLLLQEVDVDGTRSHHVDQSEMAAAVFPEYDRVFGQNYDSPYFIYPFHEPIGANKSGIMTFSRYEVTEAVRRSLPVEESLYKLIDLDRCYTVSRIPTANGRELVLYNVHLSAYTSDGTIADDQLVMLNEDMKAEYEKGNYIIAAGDFNKDLLGNSGDYFERTEGAHTWAQPIKTELLEPTFTVYSGKNFPSCRNADAPYAGDGTDFVLSVDGLIVSDNVQVLTAETVEEAFRFSDHNPVKAVFKLLPHGTAAE